ncbi:unnamed protein product [Echinostoma caproni]|uniref:CPSF_A domain-containing protein n=1 Tax=Echinostoma caproni TaxID=27848 RepID=A0A183ASI2_9TREM|nr:unnamed protein product [Echinostoma caproni]
MCLREAKRMNAGTGPSMFLKQWRSQSKVNVFVCSNHPCVIYSMKNKLVFANLNLKEVNYMTPLNGAFYSDCECSTTHNVEQYADPTSVSALERKFREIEVSSLLIFNQSNMELLFAHSFYYSQTLIEVAISITSIKLENSNGSSGVLYAVGTAFLVEEESEPSKGRIHLFQWDPEKCKLETVLVHDVNGAVYRLVRLFDIKEDSLRLACSFNENIMVLYLRRKGDFVLVGDLMRSLTLLLYKPNVNNFEAIGRHRHPRWTTCIEILDDEHFLAAEVENNLFVVSRDSPENTQEPSVRAVLAPSAGDLCFLPSPAALQRDGVGPGTQTADGDENAANAVPSSTSLGADPPASGPSTGDGRRPSNSSSSRNAKGPKLDARSSVSGEMQRLADCAYIHTGDFINVFARGSLVLQNNEERWSAIGNPAHMYGSVSGSLGLLIQINMEEFGVAGSSCVSDPVTRECTVADLVKVVEEMARLH